MTDLSVYAPLSEKVAALGPDDDLTFRPADFPDALADLTEFGGMVIDTAFLRSMGWAGDSAGNDLPFEVIGVSHGFEVYAEAEGMRRFGLWLMHLLLSGREWAGLTLTHPTSRARTFYTRIDHPMPRDHKLFGQKPQQFTGYEYWPQEVWRHPFADRAMAPVHRVDPQDRPFFAYGWGAADAHHVDFDPAAADQIIFEATPEGVAAMACLMMDMAHPTLGRDEVDMESPIVGFAATQHRSLEARFWLPNSFAFYCDTLDDLTLPPTRAEVRAMQKAREKGQAGNSDTTI
ncbi:hypothetical protein [Hasllibacter sp. MH4015]|uniref:hypothetical protein n=1 Tax=Hasllibacter sp. MH4015 TaxID=2854029 RepID=UPI001CD28A4C|nr:hypothetical protein [Hasllibacter sp. MH4015]